MFEFLIYNFQTLVACVLADTPNQFCLEAQTPLFGNESSEELNVIHSPEIASQDLATTLDRIESQQAAQARQLADLQETLARIDKKIIPPRFELVGSRFLYIEDNIWQNWTTASSTCRQWGGHMATFQGDQDLSAVYSKVDRFSFYWLIISNMSLPPGNQSSGSCFSLYEDEIGDKPCSDLAYFICEAEKEI